MTLTFDEDKQNQKFAEFKREDEENLMKMLSAKYSLPYLDLATISINTDALRLVKEAVAREAKLAPFNVVGKKVSVGILSPNNEQTTDALKSLENEGYSADLYMVSHKSLEKAWDRYKDLSYAIETLSGALDISKDSVSEFLNKIKTLSDVEATIKEVLALKKSYRISKAIEAILAGAFAVKASDIHIEPQEEVVRLRYRLDGVLHDVIDFDQETFKLMLSRIKLLSGLKLNVKIAAQDGRFSVKVADEEIEIRTSILPGAYSESIVLRILNPKAISVPLEELGIRPKLLSILLHQVGKPNGMILTTGPTGSGKTTTLYAFLKKVHTPEIKIITIEDPIEYHLQGIVQTQANPDKGYSFAEGLRSALRQDPDIIMVGEIRDQETAEIAVNSALTGHLVFSTLHTNTAAGTFPRLIDLNVNPKIISSAINVAMAQRLMRRLCVKCRQEVLIEGKAKTLIDAVVASVPKEAEEKIENKTKMWLAVGCDECNKTGYRGRIGIYEAILTDDAISKVVTEDPSEREIKKAALPQHILDMKQDGVLKVLDGTTSLDELGRVVDLEQ